MRGKPKLIKLTDRAGKLKSPYWYIYDPRTGKGDGRISTGYVIGKEDDEAFSALNTYILEKEKPTLKQPGELMLAQASKDYWEDHGRHAIGAASEEFVYDRVNRSKLIHLYASQLTQGRINEFVRETQAAGYSNGTIRKDLEHIRAALNYAHQEGRLLYVPKIKLPERPAPRERILSIDEIYAALDSCKSDHVRNTIILLLNTGQRPAAVATLKWFQVDFKEGVIHFQRTGKQKSNKRVRPVRMNQAVADLLLSLYEVKTTEYVIEQVFKKDGKVTKTRPAGNIKHGLKSVFKRIGVTEAGTGRYTLRHTFANLCDADEKTRSDIMGHTDTKTTEWHYLKANKTKHQEAMDKVGELFNPAKKLRKNSAKPKTGVMTNA